MNQDSKTIGGFGVQVREGQVMTVTLPEQEPMAESRFGQVIPAGEIIIFRPHGNPEPLENALSLLSTLYAHGVTSPHVLSVLLTATGHTKRSVAAAACAPAPQARTEVAGQPAPAE